MPTSPSFPQASWIASRLQGGAVAMPPAPYFRKSFHIPCAVRSAQLAITALGLYECEINGQRVGDLCLAPGWTDYKKRVQFQTYDAAPLLREGENVLGAILGDGWYCGRLGWRQRQTYGERPGLLAQLEVVLEDGTTLVIASDTTWKTASGPILENDILSGESYDARQELEGWSEAGFCDSDWGPVLPMPDPQIAIVSSAGPPVRRIEELKSVVMSREIGSTRLFDLGQNFSGRARITVEAARGRVLVLRFAEILGADGGIYTENLRSARATDYYTCKGGGSETWEPRFTFHGFRYVEVAGLDAGDAITVTGVVLHSDMEPIGDFACSSELLNQLQHNIVWGQKSNFLEAPTDCPQRDERLGWTGDAQVFVRTAAFNMDVHGFFRKWLQDMRDAQRPNGAIPCVVPDALNDDIEDAGPAWADAVIICPWTIYLCYGDRAILEDQYDPMVQYMDFMAEQRCLGYIRSHPDVDKWGGFGDWLALDGGGRTEGVTPRDLIGTAFYAYDTSLMAKIAAILGRVEEEKHYKALYERIVAAFQRRFVTPDGLVASDTQTSYVLALHFNLIPEACRPTAVQELVRRIEKANWHLTTGFVGTPYLLDVLEAGGRLDIAYKLLEQETFPSWLFPIKNGATTIWERWDGWTPDKGFQDKGMNSFNHYAYGAVGAWMVRSAAGLDLDEREPGYGRILFRPRPGGTLTWAQASLKTPQGMASIRWELEDSALNIDVTVPENSHATLSLPEGFIVSRSTDLGPGSYSLVAYRSDSSSRLAEGGLVLSH